MDRNKLSAEVRFKILKNGEKGDRVAEQIKKNDGYCLHMKEATNDWRCICKTFLDKKTEGPCKCGRYRKIERTDAEIHAYKKVAPWTLEEEKKKEAAEKRKRFGKQLPPRDDE